MTETKHAHGKRGGVNPWACPRCGHTLKMLCGGNRAGFYCENPKCSLPFIPSSLIAAVPELLAECKNILKRSCVPHYVGKTLKAYSVRFSTDDIASVKAAIAKAEGK